MAYIDDYNLARNNTDFQYRLATALCSTAIDIQNEATSTANHAARSAFALSVLANPLGYAQQMGPGLCADGSLVVGSTDAQIKTRVSSVWNAYCVQS
jgi:hypothetical protein